MTTLSSCYVTSQFYYQNNLFNTRKPLTEVYIHPETDNETKAKIEQLISILEFAHGSGFNVKNSYRYYIDIGERKVSYLVQASKPLVMELKTWWFPIVGEVPYLGFFEEAERDSLAQSLQAQQLDVYKTAASAFSGLGWFEDPVYSSMLMRSRANLAHLIFHELTHKTIWIASKVSFNESLAEFSAEVMTEAYLNHHGLIEDLEQYRAYRNDLNTLKHWAAALKQELQTVYKNSSLTEPKKLEMKAETIDRYTQKPYGSHEFKHYDFVGGKEWNNASILAIGVYRDDIDKLRGLFEECNMALIRFLRYLKDDWNNNPLEQKVGSSHGCGKK